MLNRLAGDLHLLSITDGIAVNCALVLHFRVQSLIVFPHLRTIINNLSDQRNFQNLKNLVWFDSFCVRVSTITVI